MSERSINIQGHQGGALDAQSMDAELHQQQWVPLKELGTGDHQRRDEVDESGDGRRAQKLLSLKDGPDREHKLELVWTNIMAFAALHLGLPVAIYLIYAQQPWLTVAYSVLLAHVSMVGVLAGAHRLWSHRSYKAKWPVQVILLVFHTMAGQNSAYTWARDHRVHHKFSETDADPHNIERGLFFAHMGWMCCKKLPDVKEKGKAIDLSDLEANPYVMFQHRYFWPMVLVFAVVVPTMIPVICWNERLWTSFVLSSMLRYMLSLHWTWTVNSLAHYHGDRPYDASIAARQSNLLIWSGMGEGAHNYHHTFPYDYRNSEFGSHYNFPKTFIDVCALLGLVTDRRVVSTETLMKRRERTGDLASKRSARVASNQ